MWHSDPVSKQASKPTQPPPPTRIRLIVCFVFDLHSYFTSLSVIFLSNVYVRMAASRVHVHTDEVTFGSATTHRTITAVRNVCFFYANEKLEQPLPIATWICVCRSIFRDVIYLRVETPMRDSPGFARDNICCASQDFLWNSTLVWPLKREVDIYPLHGCHIQILNRAIAPYSVFFIIPTLVISSGISALSTLR